MPYSNLDRRWLVLMTAVLIIVAAALMGTFTPAATLTPLISENGPFELASVALHLIVAAVALVYWRKGHSIAGLLFLACLLMAAREADLHKAFTTYGIFKTRLYFDASVPMAEKLLGGGIVLSILCAFGLLLKAASQDISRMFRDRNPAFFGLISLPLYLVVLKEIDGAPRMLRKAGLMLSDRESLISLTVEEMGETFIPIFVLIVLLQVVRTSRNARRIYS